MLLGHLKEQVLSEVAFLAAHVLQRALNLHTVCLYCSMGYSSRMKELVLPAKLVGRAYLLGRPMLSNGSVAAWYVPRPSFLPSTKMLYIKFDVEVELRRSPRSRVDRYRWFNEVFNDDVRRDSGEYSHRVLQWLLWVRQAERCLWDQVYCSWTDPPTLHSDEYQDVVVLACLRTQLVAFLWELEGSRWSFVLDCS